MICCELFRSTGDFSVASSELKERERETDSYDMF